LQGSIDHADTLKGDAGPNPIDGGDEESTPDAGLPDTLIGRSGNDLLEGFTGDDTLRGGRGADELRGGEGDDHLDGGFGIDSLDGEADTDQCVNGETVTNCE
jgi:Ca2+-binding RTX toxin-like protein